MNKKMILFLIIIICILLLNYLWKFLIWVLDLSEITPKITFKAFKEVYCLYPSKWVLKDTYVRYCLQLPQYIDIDFKHFHDYLLYCRFKKKIEKDHDYEQQLKNEEILLKNEMMLIKYLQKDIDDYRRENLNELKRLINK